MLIIRYNLLSQLSLARITSQSVIEAFVCVIKGMVGLVVVVLEALFPGDDLQFAPIRPLANRAHEVGPGDGHRPENDCVFASDFEAPRPSRRLTVL